MLRTTEGYGTTCDVLRPVEPSGRPGSGLRSGPTSKWARRCDNSPGPGQHPMEVLTMTDPTVDPAYYRDPFTYVCSNCGAVWRITAGMEPDDTEAMYERRDDHVCDPDVSRQAVDAVRARQLARGACVGMAPDLRTCPPRLFRQALELVDDVWDDTRTGLLDPDAPDTTDDARSVLADYERRAKGVL